MSFTPDEEKEFIRLLSKLERPYSQEVFFAMCGNLIMCPIEVVPLTRNGRVLMFRRSEYDPWFPGQWHIPGTIMTKGDTIESALDRVLNKDELKGIAHTDPIFLFPQSVAHGNNANENPRGQEESRVYLTWVEEDNYVGEGKFFPLNELPKETVGHHLSLHLKIIRDMFSKDMFKLPP